MRNPPRRGRRLAIRLAACTVIGAFITLTVAWALAMEQPYHGWPNWRGHYRGDGALALPQFRYKTPRGDVFVGYFRGRGW